MGDKSDLKVDYRLLEGSEESLKILRREFGRCTQRQDALAEAVGAKSLRDAMREFADNWSDNRKQTLSNISEVLEMTAKVKDSFKKTDKDLADKAKGEK
ncbi:hypothetical protein [Streptomyces sp. NPDC051776]|uniref:hypothetical protein n=1 Tax=Streptomyces sp. NPDC051776 TaxID=3155414 RepID=UPI00344A1410